MSFWKTDAATARGASGGRCKSLATTDRDAVATEDGHGQTPLQRALVRASLPDAHETVQDLVEEAIRLGMLAGVEGRVADDGMPLDGDLSYAAESIAGRIVILLCDWRH